MLVTWRRTAWAMARSFARDRSGLALTEFAFALPFLLAVGMAGTETANLAVTILRVNQLAMLAADNAARVRSSMDETDVNEVMVGLAFAGSGIKFGNYGRVIISDLEANGQTGTKAGYKITWQRCFGAKNVTSSYGVQGDGATDATMAAGMGATGNKIKPVTGSALIFAEIRYTYHPLVASLFMPDQELSAVQSFTVRERAGQTLTNTTSMPDLPTSTSTPGTGKRLCDANHLYST